MYARSDALGQVALEGLPGGRLVLDIDTTGTAAPDGSAYAGFRESLVLIAGAENRIERPFYLPRIDAASLTPVNPGATTVVENTALGVTLEIPPETAKEASGNNFSGALSISEVPPDLAPAALPEQFAPGLLVTIQPVGVTFATPVPITFPNLDHLPPGSELDIWSLDPDEGVFVVVGTGQVSADGQRIETISGGVRAADWHFTLPPAPDPLGEPAENTCPRGAQSVDSGSQTAVASGDLSLTHSLPAYRSLGRSRDLTYALSRSVK